MRSKRGIAVAEWAERARCRNTAGLARLILVATVRRKGQETAPLGREILNVLTRSVVRPVCPSGRL